MPLLHILVSGTPDTALTERIAATATERTARLPGSAPEHSVTHVIDARTAALGRGGPTQERRDQRA